MSEERRSHMTEKGVNMTAELYGGDQYLCFGMWNNLAVRFYLTRAEATTLADALDACGSHAIAPEVRHVIRTEAELPDWLHEDRFSVRRTMYGQVGIHYGCSRDITQGYCFISDEDALATAAVLREAIAAMTPEEVTA